jgi:F-type H+-transporting ATPase subunit delta
MNGKIARRYARALLAVGGEDNAQLERLGAALNTLATAVGTPEIQLRFMAPDFPPQARVQAIDRVAERLGLGFPLRSFAVVVTRHGRLADLPAIAQAYQDQLDERMGRARARLTFARPPTDAQIQIVVDGLSSIAGKTIIPTVNTDESLLGGVVAELEGKTYDGSLATMIIEAQQRLAR